MCALSLCPRELDPRVTVMSLAGFVCVTLACVGYGGVSHHAAGRGGCCLVPHLPMWWGDAARAVAGAPYVAERRCVLLCCVSGWVVPFLDVLCSQVRASTLGLGVCVCECVYETERERFPAQE